MRLHSTLGIGFIVVACAGTTPPAENPEESSSTEQSADSGSSDMASEESSEESDESAGDGEAGEGDTEGSQSGSESTESAKRLLTQEGTSFLYDFSRSDPGMKAKERCEKSSGGDAVKNANCMNKATKAVRTQGFKFERDKEQPDQWWFVRFEIKGHKPIEHNRVKAEFADDSGKKITIKTTGPDKARAPKGAVPASFEIELPDQYTLVIEEPGKGKMIYEPKLGLFDEG